MMYDFAVENTAHSCFDKKAAYLGEPPLFYRKQWIAKVTLPTKGEAVLRFIVHERSGIVSIMEATKCVIEVRKLVKQRLEKCR